MNALRCLCCKRLLPLVGERVVSRWEVNHCGEAELNIALLHCQGG